MPTHGSIAMSKEWTEQFVVSRQKLRQLMIRLLYDGKPWYDTEMLDAIIDEVIKCQSTTSKTN